MVPRRPSLTLSQIVERIAKFAPPRHRELVRGMVAELDSIVHPAERTRFALGAIAAVARLMLRGYSQTTAQATSQFVGLTKPENDADHGGPTMSKLTTRQLLQRHATPFVVSFASLTVLLFVNHAIRQVPQLSARGAQGAAIAEVLLLAVPFTTAMTIPMAVFLAVSWVFTRLGADGILAAAVRERHGVRRLVAPVLGAAAVIATLTLVLNSQVVPHANARLAAVLAGAPSELNDRTMTIGELTEAARIARTATGAEATARAAAYEVEIQKKFALAAACMIFALAGAAIAIRFPHGGVGLVVGASGFVFTGYYLSLVAGEALADGQVVSPFVAMWMANAFLLSVVLVLAWRPSRSGPMGEAETLAIGG